MTNINESALWEKNIHQIQRGERVVGGLDGVANVQAAQLANRTQYLKAAIDDNPDLRGFTFYITESDPDGTRAGLAATTKGQLFRVAQGVGGFISFINYRNDGGKAVAVAYSNAAGSAMAFKDVATLLAFVPTTAHALAMDASSGSLYFWSNGAWEKAPDPQQEEIDNLKQMFGLMPDGSFAIKGNNGVIFHIGDLGGIIQALEAERTLSVKNAGVLSSSELPFIILGANGLALALTKEGVLNTVSTSVGGNALTDNPYGLAWSVMGQNGFAAALTTDSELYIKKLYAEEIVTGGESSSPQALNLHDRYFDAEGNLSPVNPDMLKMSGWGSSSFTQGGVGVNFTRLAAELGVTDWNNQGQGGETSFHVAARFGAVPFTLKFPDDTLPASGSVAVACQQLPSNYYSNYLKSYDGTLHGVAGNLKWDNQLKSLSFTRAAAGDAVALSGPEDFIPSLPVTYRDGVVLLWMYKNDLKFDAVTNPEITMDTIFNNVVKTVMHVSTMVKRVVVIGVFNDSAYGNDIYKTRLAEMNRRCKEKFGPLYVDTQDYMCSAQIWTDAGITPTPSDLTMQAQGYKATSLSLDAAHLNMAAHKAVVENVIKAHLLNLNWYK
ncbi:hypothetical protein GA565_19830 [Rouxiella sp. S1S-2]|uniref:hypothetical protein n=1 Tax=Rouxiella sp. S1S-2 TaxID=2653856 RepID=UPI0012651766|nr:hypothetical protein [Rouxiella sp. S1S-2]KAB7898044.1 hypothetical protein GA565_19830 [Rouxiella sp. S1S-2]